ncbi:MAG TPA: hypothetical protein VIA06_04095 [Candidatus Dormibacteraeota bacterium]|jgi:hypothetical protein|nr:hypothetical protein [Candidatus Dormibacteraeota bacterium]
MASQAPRRQGRAPRVRRTATPCTDSDLNELLAALGTQVRRLRGENKQLASHNGRLALVLCEQGRVVIDAEPAPESPVTPGVATAAKLAAELRRRILQLEREGGGLRRENARLADLVSRAGIPAWRLQETRIGGSKLIPGQRAFIRRRRSGIGER